MAQVKKGTGSGRDLMLPMPETDNPDSLRYMGSDGGQPGDAQGMADPGYLEGLEKAKLETEMDLSGVDLDPALQGTAQPGELYMAPGSPEFEKAVDAAVKRNTEIEVGKNFSMWDIVDDLGLKFNLFDKEKK